MSSATQAVVWIVDDAESVRNSLAAVLEAASLTVQVYASAPQFLKDFVPGSIGCLIVDQHMPEMTGLDLLQLLKARHIALPSIVITGHGDTMLSKKAKQAGAITMLHKPVDGDELVTLIEGILKSA